MGLLAQNQSIEGQVLSAEDQQPLPGASIRINQSNRALITDEQGNFSLSVAANQVTLTISFIGFETQEQVIQIPLKEKLVIFMQPESVSLDGVEVFATGYQEIPKERQTGSFVGLNEKLINRRISTSILDRLEDVTPGLVFNRNGSRTDKISIRGRSTLFSDATPLIVIDNFPYDGPIESINPNDVASISVLRDAAAASIWGARAGNGVIVITTKSGKKGEGTHVSLMANATWTERPDPFYLPLMSSAEVIGMERKLFEDGYYNSRENSSSKQPLTPVVENLILNRDGQISDAELAQRLGELEAFDVRNDYRDYLYRKGLNQQYSLSLSGGGTNYRYYLAAGWDGNQSNLEGNSAERTTLMSNQNLTLLDGKLQLGMSLNVILNQSDGSNQGPAALRFNGASPLYSYAQLVDDGGNPVGYYPSIREGFALEAEEAGLFSWQLNPLEELDLIRQRSQGQDVRLNLSADYELIPGLHAEVYYQYWKGSTSSENLALQGSYEARNLINRYTQAEGTGVLSNAIPVGAIMDQNTSESKSHNLRSLLRLDKKVGSKGQINALAGYEVKTLRGKGFGNRYYGYNPETGISIPVDYISVFSLYPNPVQGIRIPYADQVRGSADNFLSAFMNGSYHYDSRYTVTFSARRDASNLFGVNTNQKTVPLWSTGLSWNLTGESWQFPKWIEFLRLRTTYGVNGNVNKQVAALTTSRMVGTSRFTSFPVANLISPPNPNLKWERIRILNIGSDFDLIGGRLSGSFEYYKKLGEDLIGDLPFAPNSGVEEFRGNFANTLTKGFDLQISGTIIDRSLKWNLDYFHSHVREKVESYEQQSTVLNYLGQSTGADPSSPIFPLEGRPVYAVYSLPFAGLDPDTGDPMGYLDGEISSDYATIINNAEPEDLTYHGSARPTHFGSLRNTFSFKNWSLSANLVYRLGYYYRKNSVRYVPVLSGEQGHGDFSDRWQEPGDELLTNIPSLPESRNTTRDNFYSFSSILVEKGDHIRLQDIRLSYSFPNFGKSGLGSLELFTYANNLGILWKAAEDDLDPDFRTMKPLSSLAFGLRLTY